jgi:hypothetical protein
MRKDISRLPSQNKQYLRFAKPGPSVNGRDADTWPESCVVLSQMSRWLAADRRLVCPDNLARARGMFSALFSHEGRWSHKPINANRFDGFRWAWCVQHQSYLR